MTSRGRFIKRLALLQELEVLAKPHTSRWPVLHYSKEHEPAELLAALGGSQEGTVVERNGGNPSASEALIQSLL